MYIANNKFISMGLKYQMPVLLYHRVVNSGSTIGKHKLHVSESNFRNQMQWLKKNNYQTITFRELANATALDKSRKQIILTFDDGYDDNYTILFPILKEFGFTAVVFLVTACKQNDWSIAQGEPAIRLMNAAEIKEMDAYGVEFGGHTRHHVDLKNTDLITQEDEIGGCYKELEKLLDKKPVSFSYPYGAYNDSAINVVKQSGFDYAVTTIFGPHEFSEDLVRIRRLELRPKSGLYNFKRKASGVYFQTNFFSFLFK